VQQAIVGLREDDTAPPLVRGDGRALLGEDTSPELDL
jgi:hypothetical protein